MRIAVAALVVSCVFTFTFASVGAADEARPPATAPSAEVEAKWKSGIDLYELQKFEDASLVFFDIAESQSPEYAARVHDAEFFLAKTLYQMRYFDAAFSRFDKIVERGRDHKHFGATLNWLALLAHRLAGDSAVLERIARFSRNDFPAGIRNELSYLLGKHLFQTGDLKRAEEILRGVQASSAFFTRAQFVFGLVQVRFGRAEEAAKAFRTVAKLVPAGNAATEIGPLRELAQLNLARVFYQVEQFRDARRYYGRLKRTSPNWIAAVFEVSWSEFRERNFAKALGNLLTIDSPYYENEFFPEALLLRALIGFRNCQYDRVDKTVDLFLKKYEPLANELKKQIQRLGDASDKYYDYFLEMRKGKGPTDPRVLRVLKLSLADRALARLHEFVGQLDRELAAIRSTTGVWRKSALARSLFEAVSFHREQASLEAGKRVRDRFVSAHAELEKLVQHAYRLQFGTNNARLNRLTATEREEQEFEPAPPPRAAGEGEVVFPFDGEFWRDELGQYEYEVKSECVKK